VLEFIRVGVDAASNGASSGDLRHHVLLPPHCSELLRAVEIILLSIMSVNIVYSIYTVLHGIQVITTTIIIMDSSRVTTTMVY
jgi:hypothetical protein